MKRLALIALLAVTVAGCDLGDPGTHVPEPAVEAWLIGGREFPPIRLTWTQSVEVPYGSVPVGIDDAEVTVTLLGRSLQPVRVVRYRAAESSASVDSSLEGWYEPAFDPAESLADLVVPGATYRLDVTIPGYSAAVRAVTTVPGDFDVKRVANDTVIYQSTDQVEIDVTRSEYPGRDAVYVLTMESLEPSFENLTPFIRDAIYGIAEGESFNIEDIDFSELQDNVRQSSPPLNEANWEVNPDGSLKLRMPWFFVSFFGTNELTVAAIDDNLWNFLRGVNAQEGNGGLAPGEIPNVDGGIEGGQGLFGSLTRVTRSIRVLPR